MRQGTRIFVASVLWIGVAGALIAVLGGGQAIVGALVGLLIAIVLWLLLWSTVSWVQDGDVRWWRS